VTIKNSAFSVWTPDGTIAEIGMDGEQFIFNEKLCRQTAAELSGSIEKGGSLVDNLHRYIAKLLTMILDKQSNKHASILPDIKDGDTVILTGDSHRYESINFFAQKLSARGTKDVTLFIIPQGQSIEVINDEEMERHGWVRKPFVGVDMARGKDTTAITPKKS